MDIKFERFTLSNGLKVIFHQDLATPMIVFNVLYDVGAKDEDPDLTGFAHLTEHLMFGGSVHIPSYDEPLQMAGGENNAYTTNDYTNYYIQLPAENMETAFWLESDRMLSLGFSQESLDVQKKVVIEEFKEHYLSKPYGSAWHLLRKLAYQVHPYQWMTIGKNLQQIEKVTLDDVKSFFSKYYRPSNAIICIAGNAALEKVKQLTEKWFSDLPDQPKLKKSLPQEPIQNSARHLTFEADVPVPALYKVWHIDARLSKEYYAADLLSEILGNGKSSRFFHKLVKEQQIFSSIQCYHTGSLEPGLFVIEGKLAKEITLEFANAALEDELTSFIKEGVSPKEFETAQNKIEVQVVFEDMSLIARANNLAFYELLGDAAMMNRELDKYQEIEITELNKIASKIFQPNNSSTLFYKPLNEQDKD